MDIDSLRLIILLSRTLNFTKASSESFMTQPTLSRKIVQCEEELGIKIFNRSTHSVSLTEAGREVIDDIQRIVSLYDELSGYCHSLDKEKPLKIGYSVYPYGLSFCMKVEEFLKKNGDNIASSIDFIPLEESVKALADGNDFFCVLGCEVDFQTMSHVEHLVHLGPVSAALFLNGLE